MIMCASSCLGRATVEVVAGVKLERERRGYQLIRN